MLPTAVRIALAATLVAVLAILAAPAHAASSSLDARFSVAGDEVDIAGTLTSDGRPLRRADVVATLDGREMDSDKTDNDGEFSLSFDLPSLAAGDHVLAVTFAGSGQADPASAQVTITVGASDDGGDDGGGGGSDDGGDGGGGDSGSGGGETQEPAQPAALTLTAQAGGSAVNGSVVTITGSLTDANGNGIGNAGISIHDARGEVDESFTVTTSGGAYEALYAVPEDQPSGELVLTVSFAGTEGLSAASARVAISVEFTEVASASPSPSATPSPTPSATPSPTVSASPSADAGTTPATPTEDTFGPASWFLVASVVVGGAALLTTAFIVFRSSRASRLDDDEGTTIDFLDDTHADPDVSQTEVLGDMLGGELAGDEPTTTIKAPRRALPED